MLISRIRRWFLFKELERGEIKCDDRFLLQTNRLLIISYLNNGSDLDTLTSFKVRMENDFDFVDMVYFTKQKDLKSEISISSKDISWTGKVTRQLILNLLNKEYDQMWVIASKVPLSMEYLISKIKSRLKLGPYLNETYRDCHIFTHSNSYDVPNIIKELEDIMLKLSNNGQ